MPRALAVLLLGLVLVGTAAAATIRGTARADRIAAVDGRRQTIVCGRGLDVVNADLVDRVAADCEVVARRIARDTTGVAGGAQHATILEPDSSAFGNTIVAAFQVGRVPAGGAGTIGWASSRDAGVTWRSGTLPGVGHASDPTVAFDQLHNTWLVVTLGITNGPTSLDVNRSTDGRTWTRAQPALSAAVQSFDKEWIFCDNGATSPHRGTCYLAYTNIRNETIELTSSVDGGVTWSPPRRISASGDVVDGMPAVLPDGTVVVTWLEGSEGGGGGSNIAAARSTDGGLTFSAPARVNSVQFVGVRGLRAPPLPALDVDRNGRLLLAWPDCRFRSGCAGDDIVLATSTDGIAWSAPRRVTTGTGSYSTPGLAADQASDGIAVSAQVVPGTPGSPLTVGMSLSVSRNGTTWAPTRRVDARPMLPGWLPVTDGGRFLGDYMAASWAGGRPYAIVPIASPPRAGRLNQALYAATVR